MALVEAVLHRIVFVYRFGHPLRGFQNVGGVGEAVVRLIQFVPFVFRQLVLCQVLQLPLQTLALQLQLFTLLLCVLQLFTGRLPHGISLFHFLGKAQAACVSIEQIALGGFFV